MIWLIAIAAIVLFCAFPPSRAEVAESLKSVAMMGLVVGVLCAVIGLGVVASSALAPSTLYVFATAVGSLIVLRCISAMFRGLDRLIDSPARVQRRFEKLRRKLGYS